MFSFDLSITNILLIAGVVALFILFITVLIKLNPSTQKRKTPERDLTIEKQKPFHAESSAPHKRSEPEESIPSTTPTEKPLVIANTAVGGPSIPTTQENKMPFLSRSKEVVSKPEKIAVPKTEVNTSSKRDCLHQFGYLRTLPKNAPIPDECFGCQKIVECLVKAKTR
jgi:hypothetical protein